MKKLSQDLQTLATKSKSTEHSDRVIVDELTIQFIRKQLLRSMQIASGQVSALPR